MFKKCLLLNIVIALSINTVAPAETETKVDDAATVLAAQACQEADKAAQKEIAPVEQAETPETTVDQKSKSDIVTAFFAIISIPVVCVVNMLRHQSECSGCHKCKHNH